MAADPFRGPAGSGVLPASWLLRFCGSRWCCRDGGDLGAGAETGFLGSDRLFRRSVAKAGSDRWAGHLEAEPDLAVVAARFDMWMGVASWPSSSRRSS